MAIVLRGTGDSRQLAATVRKLVLAPDRELPIFNVRPMDRLLADSVAAVPHDCGGRLTQELGICMALGAQTKDLLRLMDTGGFKR
jgi:hypothetical protein